MSLQSFILSLSQLSKEDSGKAGSKAANLGELIRNGFPIPEGFVVTTVAYSRFLTENALENRIMEPLEAVHYSDPGSLARCSKAIQAAIERSELPAQLVKEIKAGYASLQSQPLAIRSSATSEDLPTASFAGQLETFLNVRGFDNILQHVKRCYASLWTDKAIAYRHQNRIPHAGVEMAVIIQAMVSSKSAGVLFTVNPVSSDRSEMLIESNFGLGESIVSGRAMPDRFTVRTSNETKGEPFRIISREVATKQLAAQAPQSEAEIGVDYIKISGKDSVRPSILDKQIHGLAKLGREIELCFGCPQDIEWAIDEEDHIRILQSRPITSLTLPEDEDEIMWTRGYSDDYWNDPVTPLFFGLLGDQLTEIVNVELNKIMDYSQPGSRKTDQLLKLHHGHAYFNLEVLKQKVEYEIPTFLRNDDILNYFPGGDGSYGKGTMKELPFRTRKRLIAEIRVMILDPAGSVNKTASAYDAWTRDIFTPFLSEFNSRMAELAQDGEISAYLNLADDLDRVMVKHFRLVRYGIPVHNIGMNLLTQYLLTRFLGREAALKAYPILISGLKHKTCETNSCINSLVEVIRSSKELTELILEVESEKLYNVLSSMKSPDTLNFIGEVDAFMREFGVRGFTREPYYPRWYEKPEYIFDILKSLTMDAHQDNETVESKNLERRLEIEKEVERGIRSQRFGIIKWKLFSKILGFARRYIVFRENQRFNLDRWITMNRRIYLEIGKGLKGKGILTDPSDIFFLDRDEIHEIVANEAIEGIPGLISNRKTEFQRYEHITPSKFLQGQREFNDPPPTDLRSLQGIPASQGILKSQVRVLNRIQDILQVRAGEILVVPRTDPGWTPIFCKIGGLITETGGILSHGAVVSREYGIPAVTNIPNACKLLRTGQTITIDGNKGVISLENQ